MTRKDNCKVLLSMLKNCGVKFSIVFSLGNIQHGYGDEVCYILNDLSTDLLVRRNYEFSSPVIIGDIDSRGQRQTSNFDDYDLDDMREAIGDMDDCGSDVIVDMALVDEHAWKDECARLESDLRNLEKELDQGYSDRVDLHQGNLINSRRLSNEIHRVATLLRESKLSHEMEIIQEEISLIYDREKSLTNMNAEYLEEVKHFCENNKEYDEEILRLTLGNKRKIDEYCRLKATHQGLVEEIKQRQSMHTDNSRLLSMKDSIARLKVVPG